MRAVLSVLAALLLGGCSTVSPDPALVHWGEPDAWWVANLHAERIQGGAWEIAPTGSMEPFLTGGDYVVGSFDAPWEGIKPGDVLLYDANWRDPDLPLVCHLAVQRSGDGWIMTGIASPYSESGSRTLMRSDYRASVVAAYTPRAKP